ncbi:hypothetical protein M8C21_033057 [Ambrosia artemisiifolia]|uniref:Protein kinase domain-containing protein n=1 Tax=Ambrosia artemisiifolia TaxID=4212 RepID=A0AAD5CHF8_AMBAR|nr:hypothetical protein M8C21_033057 [Ambrosia artemisiifolia]
MHLHLLRWLPAILLTFIHSYHAQQTYVNNTQLDCSDTSTTAYGYTCNGPTTCLSYLTFRSQPPYTAPTTIATLLNSDPTTITSLNNFSSISATIPTDTFVVVPISNCSCSDGGWYQHNASYVVQGDDNYFTLANNTYQGLTTCQAMMKNNPYDLRGLEDGDKLTVPIRCACPTAKQTAVGIRYLLTFLITWGNTVEYMAELFKVDVQSILDANTILENDIIFPFTPILIPLTTELLIFNNSAMPAPPPAPPVIPVAPSEDGTSGSSNKWVFVGVGIGVGLLVIVLLSRVLVLCFRKRKIQQQQHGLPTTKHSSITALFQTESSSWLVSSEGVRIAIGSLTVYKYEELQKATSDFSEENKVKGHVYRGIFNGDYVAVKIMNGDVSGEINILKQINHSNIIRLYGLCLHEENTYLVYEFAENCSLSDWLHSTTKDTKYDSVLDWKQRVQIAHDIADGLNYLHNFITPPYIHKNLNSSNVLLDMHMRAKITKFGLARSMEETDNRKLQLTRHVVGTYGYMPPEYIENGLITHKMDVFALGVLILELLSGKEAAARSVEGGDDANDVAELEERLLSEMVKEVVRGGDDVREKLAAFMDDRLIGEYPVEMAYSMAHIASKCVAADLNDRPSVSEVFAILSTILSSSLDWDPSDEREHALKVC